VLATDFCNKLYGYSCSMMDGICMGSLCKFCTSILIVRGQVSLCFCFLPLVLGFTLHARLRPSRMVQERGVFDCSFAATTLAALEETLRRSYVGKETVDNGDPGASILRNPVRRLPDPVSSDQRLMLYIYKMLRLVLSLCPLSYLYSKFARGAVSSKLVALCHFVDNWVNCCIKVLRLPLSRTVKT